MVSAGRIESMEVPTEGFVVVSRRSERLLGGAERVSDSLSEGALVICESTKVFVVSPESSIEVVGLPEEVAVRGSDVIKLAGSSVSLAEVLLVWPASSWAVLDGDVGPVVCALEVTELVGIPDVESRSERDPSVEEELVKMAEDATSDVVESSPLSLVVEAGVVAPSLLTWSSDDSVVLGNDVEVGLGSRDSGSTTTTTPCDVPEGRIVV